MSSISFLWPSLHCLNFKPESRCECCIYYIVIVSNQQCHVRTPGQAINKRRTSTNGVVLRRFNLDSTTGLAE